MSESYLYWPNNVLLSVWSPSWMRNIALIGASCWFIATFFSLSCLFRFVPSLSGTVSSFASAKSVARPVILAKYSTNIDFPQPTGPFRQTGLLDVIANAKLRRFVRVLPTISTSDGTFAIFLSSEGKHLQRWWNPSAERQLWGLVGWHFPRPGNWSFVSWQRFPRTKESSRKFSTSNEVVTLWLVPLPLTLRLFCCRNIFGRRHLCSSRDPRNRTISRAVWTDLDRILTRNTLLWRIPSPVEAITVPTRDVVSLDESCRKTFPRKPRNLTWNGCTRDCKSNKKLKFTIKN